MEHEQDSTATSSSSSRLLSLPPELRVMIFEFVLISGRITISPSAVPAWPALLSTNRQVREEALKIWYGKNLFSFTVVDCDGSLANKFRRNTQWKIYHPQKDNALVNFQGRPDWRNLMDWCRDVHCGSATAIFSIPKEHREDVSKYPLLAVLAAAQEISAASRARRERWSTCKATLKSLRMVAGVADRRWLD